MFSKATRFCFAFLLVSFSVLSLHANEQVVYLRDGKTLIGEIVSQTAVKIVLKLPDGTTKEILKQDIRRVAFKGAIKPADTKDNTPIVPVPDPNEAQKKEEDAKKQVAAADEKAEKRKKEIEESKRNKLEVFLGSGSGTLIYQSPDFYGQTISIGSSLGSSGGKWQYESPSSTQGGKASAAEIRYSWNRYVGQVGGSNFQSTSTITSFGQDSDNSGGPLFPKFTTGSFQNSLKHVYGKLSYSVYPHPKHDIRPTVGIHRLWIKTDNAEPFTYGTGSSPAFTDQFSGIIPFSVAEFLKGYSYGLQYDVKLGGNFEIRSAFEIMHFKGDGKFQQTSYVDRPLGGGLNIDSFGVYNTWTAKGASLDLKFLYNWKYGVNFWMGISGMSLHYTVSNTNLSFQNNASTVSDLYFAKILFDSVLGPSYAKDTKTSAILLGVSYAYDFSR